MSLDWRSKWARNETNIVFTFFRLCGYFSQSLIVVAKTRAVMSRGWSRAINFLETWLWGQILCGYFNGFDFRIKIPDIIFWSLNIMGNIVRLFFNFYPHAKICFAHGFTSLKKRFVKFFRTFYTWSTKIMSLLKNADIRLHCN